MSPTVFVTGATGTQGGAVARQLLAVGWQVRTTTRDPSSPASQALSALGVELTQANWSDAAILTSALSGCSKLFLLLVPNIHDPTSEPTFAKNFLDAAASAGVNQVIYSGNLPTHTLPGYDSKHWTAPIREAKRHVESLLSSVHPAEIKHWTVIRPGNFMANFINPKMAMNMYYYPYATKTGVFVAGVPPDTTLIPLVDHEDIAKLAVAAFQDPERFHRKKIGIASQKLSVREVVDALARVSGRRLRVEYYPSREEADGDGIDDQKIRVALEMQRGLIGVDELVDLEEVRQLGVQTNTFDAFLEREREEVEKTYEAVQRTDSA